MRRAAVAITAIAILAIALVEYPARPALRAEGAWVRAAPAGTGTAAYLTLVDDGPAPLALAGASAGVAETLSLHATMREGGVLRMLPADSLAVPAHGRRRLAPGGDHLMLSGLRAPLVAGGHVAIVLRFSDGRTLAVDAVVRE